MGVVKYPPNHSGRKAEELVDFVQINVLGKSRRRAFLVFKLRYFSATLSGRRMLRVGNLVFTSCEALLLLNECRGEESKKCKRRHFRPSFNRRGCVVR